MCTAREHWIGGPGQIFRAGDLGFLVERVRSLRPCTTTWDLRPWPAATNMGREALYRGWAGTTVDVAVYAHGIAVVVRAAGDAPGRWLVQELAGEEERAALGRLGYDPDDIRTSSFAAGRSYLGG